MLCDVFEPEDEFDCTGVVAVVVCFGGAGFAFSPGITVAAPTAVIRTLDGPWRLEGFWSAVETGAGVLAVFDELPITYATANATTAATAATARINTPERLPAFRAEARF